MIFQESVNIVRLSSVFAKTVTGNLFVIFYALSKVAVFMLYQILYMQTKISTGSVQQIFLLENNLPAVRWQILLSDFEMSKIPYENTENCSRASCTLNDVIQSIRNACKAVLP